MIAQKNNLRQEISHFSHEYKHRFPWRFKKQVRFVSVKAERRLPYNLVSHFVRDFYCSQLWDKLAYL